MPKLWTQTIDEHRRAVRDAILDTTAALAMEHGLASVSMSQIAGTAGIGRATLYKYFPDVEAILLAWHEREITAHLGELAEVRDRTADPRARLEAVLERFALISRGSHGHHQSDLASFLHRDGRVGHARLELHHMVQDLITECVAIGAVRKDIPSDELAGYCLHALAAAGGLGSKAAVTRLVAVTLAGLGPPD